MTTIENRGNLGVGVLWPVRWNVGLDREKPAVLIGTGPVAAGGGGTDGQSQTMYYLQTAANYVSLSTNKMYKNDYKMIFFLVMPYTIKENQSYLCSNHMCNSKTSLSHYSLLLMHRLCCLTDADLDSCRHHTCTVNQS